jgi:hypothetical protein
VKASWPHSDAGTFVFPPLLFNFLPHWSWGDRITCVRSWGVVSSLAAASLASQRYI